MNSKTRIYIQHIYPLRLTQCLFLISAVILFNILVGQFVRESQILLKNWAAIDLIKMTKEKSGEHYIGRQRKNVIINVGSQNFGLPLPPSTEILGNKYEV